MTNNLIPVDYSKFSGRNIVRSLLINVLINTLIAVILVAIGFGRGFVVNLIFSQCIGMSIYGANLAAIPLFKRAARPLHQIIIISAAVIIGAGVGTFLGAIANGLDPVRYARDFFPFFGQVILLGLLFGSIISYIFISVGKITDEKMRRLEAEKNALEAELKLLQSQIEPHFLFNTLTNIISLIDSSPVKARTMLEAFTAFLRASFLTTRDRTVPLHRELEVVKNYLDVFIIRMGDRLQYRIEVPDDLREFPVPPLLIQPLVENSVKHGLEPAKAGGAILVRAAREQDCVRITVADSGLGISEKSGGRGIGLENIRKRLQLAYGDRGRLMVEENTPNGVLVTIEIPL
jgi:signal transduction histidine kinase